MDISTDVKEHSILLGSLGDYVRKHWFSNVKDALYHRIFRAVTQMQHSVFMNITCHAAHFEGYDKCGIPKNTVRNVSKKSKIIYLVYIWGHSLPSPCQAHHVYIPTPCPSYIHFPIAPSNSTLFALAMPCVPPVYISILVSFTYLDSYFIIHLSLPPKEEFLEDGLLSYVTTLLSQCLAHSRCLFSVCGVNSTLNKGFLLQNIGLLVLTLPDTAWTVVFRKRKGNGV